MLLSKSVLKYARESLGTTHHLTKHQNNKSHPEEEVSGGFVGVHPRVCPVLG